MQQHLIELSSKHNLLWLKIVIITLFTFWSPEEFRWVCPLVVIRDWQSLSYHPSKISIIDLFLKKGCFIIWKIGMEIKAFYKGLYGKPVIHVWVARMVACLQLPSPRVILPIQILLIFGGQSSLFFWDVSLSILYLSYFFKKNHFCVMSLNVI